MENGNLSVFDAKQTLEQVDGDRVLLKELVEIFSGQYKKQIELLTAGIAKNDAPSVRLAAHTIKGSVAHFGAQPAFDLSFRLEQMGRDGALAEASAACAALTAELSRLETALREFVKE